MIHERFKQYFHTTFFQGKDEEFREFMESLEIGIPRTIRIKPGKIEEVKAHLAADGWILGTTPVYNVFSLDRREDFDPLERRIGFSLDHLLGDFYIQELAAAHPVDILADSRVQEDEFLILDMASSPGGKTTQLAEYYPNSFIVANEPTRERIPQILQNLDRMGSANIGVTLYGGQYWKSFPETFDRILLDAPCSGEGTLYKGTDATKHWHIKNIKTISKLQEKLLEASLHALKIGGEMIYSTCSLNLLEDEGVVESMTKKYPGTFEILFQKKFWPHIDKTGGFFVTKIRKIASLPNDHTGEKVRNSNTSLKKWHKHSGFNALHSPLIDLFEHDGKILAGKNTGIVGNLREEVYFMRFGEYIGQIENGKYVPAYWGSRFISTKDFEKYSIKDEIELDLYLRGNEIYTGGVDGYIEVSYNGKILGIDEQENGIIKNRFPTDWRRR